ncbi:Tetratricopeptide repeat-containing protein [Tenacibaculum sp. MAR_2009_124]|uniref:tetratricopeptide repeat-containing sensor histidine kinase n=1 Tax=Tenacibaculum sp. MAR_2009_124 TaxID=1250059 RepID=UPI0008965485|nr:histidine kinase [Tenacibaculum sp. MAR_2009_124]SED07137.1 Tetratricopeptide repeat-containing protein [Tenacibaculum sp. MAR_2009_124]
MSSTLKAQEEKSVKFSIKVKVIDKETRESIENAEVTVAGIQYNYSKINENYKINARYNDELIVRHFDFETVYYTIKGNDEIIIKVEKENKLKVFNKISKSSRSLKKRKFKSYFSEYIDSAKLYKEKSLDKSLSFIELTLKEELTRGRKAEAFKVMGDIYFFWRQYDLASQNYDTSLKQKDNVAVRLLLAKSQFLSKKYKESEKTYISTMNQIVSNFDKLTLFEGLGDVSRVLREWSKAETNYKTALSIAQNLRNASKITDLNSKLAEVFANLGQRKKADLLFQNSLELATQENVKRSLEQEEKVADYLNSSQRYDEEIQLRKESLKKAEEITVEADDAETLVDSITSQKISYKIGNAYLQKEEYDEAIPFFEKSISDADKNEDLIIKKDATRKLSEVYATVGDYTKAFESYRDYVKLVDTLYAKREQEIQQVKRFSKRISDNQNRIASLEKDKELADSKIDLAYKDQQLVQESNKRQEIIIYSLITGMVLISLLMYYMYRNIRQQKLANNLLALKSMRSQMNPHFIFNALNSVNSFIAVNDERSANRYLSEFSVLMRSVLENSDEDFIPLSKETELLQLYVKLEHNRFQDKFDYEIKIDDKIPLDTYIIPPMLLQPYIENAIWHGLRYKKEKGYLCISMEQIDNDVVRVLIEDNGIGRKRSMEMKTKNQLKQKSKGMSTIKKRIGILNDMYQDKIEVKVADATEAGEGTKVELLLKKIKL